MHTLLFKTKKKTYLGFLELLMAIIAALLTVKGTRVRRSSSQLTSELYIDGISRIMQILDI